MVDQICHISKCNTGINQNDVIVAILKCESVQKTKLLTTSVFDST